MRKAVLRIFIVLCALNIAAHSAHAQTQTQPAEAAPEGIKIEVEKEIRPEQIPSVLYTYWEQVAIQDARRSVGTRKTVQDWELTPNQAKEDPGLKPPPEERDIRLGGIVYRAKDDWTIWLNEERITPDALPEEIIDLRVFKDYIDLKWYDRWTNKIFPIRLRAHQRFNIDTRIFLPG